MPPPPWEAQNGDDLYRDQPDQRRRQPRLGAGHGPARGWLSSRPSNQRGLPRPAQIRWSPTNIANTAEEALSRLFTVFEGGDEFAAVMTGGQEVPPVTTTASAAALFALNPNGTLSFELRATGPIANATQAHIHIGGSGQNGPSSRSSTA
jgi:hypothetical protein